MNIKRVMVVEDQRMFREFLVSWLEREGYTVVGEAGGLEEAERLMGVVEPDLVLLDLDLPDGSGMRLVEGQSRRKAAPRILVLTAHVESYPVLKLKRSGVMGVIDKGEASGEELRRAVGTIAEWRTYYSQRVEMTFRNLISETTAYYKVLSPREEELVKLFGLGQTNEEIAIRQQLSVATIQGHRRNVMSKVGVKSTPELIIWAIRNGFVNGPEIGRLAV